LNHFTAGKGPWAILFLKKHISKREAFAELKWFKNLNQKSIQKLIDSKENLCKGLY
jgi:predicted GIY-YIG superfamily endonuclease